MLVTCVVVQPLLYEYIVIPGGRMTLTVEGTVSVSTETAYAVIDGTRTSKAMIRITFRSLNKVVSRVQIMIINHCYFSERLTLFEKSTVTQ